jgi:hypothetical protein
MNPGKDLLVAANWEAVFAAVPPAANEPAIVTGERVPIAPGNLMAASTPVPVRPVDMPNERRGMGLLASVTLAFVCIIILILGIAMLRSFRKQ